MFRGAIRGLDINDVFGVLRGGPTAATQLLDTRTRPQLITLFAPPVRTGLDSSGASNAMDRIQRRYGSRMGTLAAVFGDGDPNLTLKDRLTNYAVGKALDGLFFYVGEEEKAIRADPAKRTTDLLRRVFGL